MKGFLEEQTYEMDIKQKKEVSQLISKRLEQDQRIEFALLHGSFTSDLPFHDIDVAVFFKGDISEEDRYIITTDLSLELTRELSIPVDIHSLNESKLSFCYKATKGEILFYQDREQFLDFREEISMKYLDFEPYIKYSLRDMLNIS